MNSSGVAPRRNGSCAYVVRGLKPPATRRVSLREEGIRPATLWRLSTQLRFSLRSPLRFAAERHLMVARPFKAGKECPKWVSSRSDD